MKEKIIETFKVLDQSYMKRDEIREIILSDWTYWGNIHFDIENIRITNRDSVA
jgi:hypothetical protein